MFLYMYIYIYTHIYIYIYIYTYIYIYIYIYIYTYTYVCQQVCMNFKRQKHVCVHISVDIHIYACIDKFTS